MIGLLGRRPAGTALPLFRRGDALQPLIVRRVPGARGLRLIVDPRDGAVRLTLPPRAGLKAALAWVEGKRDWIEAELARLPVARPFVPGAEIPFDGGTLRIAWDADAPRTPLIDAGRLRLGGPAEAVPARVARWLRAEALRRLEAETRAIAADAGVTIGRVGVGDARGRWGSCSATGDIRYSWRLILAPSDVRRATVAHEVAHRLHMDHSPAFHAAAARLFGRDPAPERAWLRRRGAELHWWGRADG